MSYGVDKVKLILRFGGEWVEGNEGWDFVFTSETVEHRVKLFLNCTYQHLVDYVQKKCGIDTSVGETKVVYKHDGELLRLIDDEHVSGFMHFASQSRKPPTLFVYVDYSMCNEGDGGSTSNTTNQEAMYTSQGVNESQMQQSSDHRHIPDPTYGLSDYYPDVVLETQQQEEGQQEDKDEEEHRKFIGFATDEAHVFNLGLSDLDLADSDDDEQEAMAGNTLREGVNDYFDMPHLLPTQAVSMTTSEVVPYNRSARVTEGQIFETKYQMIIEVGMKCLHEGFEHKTKRSTKDRYEVVCVQDDCGWRMTARGVGNEGTFHVRKLNDVHTCSRTQLNPKHRQANKKVLGSIMKNKFINARRALRP